MLPRLFWLSCCLCALFACTSNQPNPTEANGTEQTQEATKADGGGIPADLDLVMKAQDFGCILNWDKVDRYRITNKLGFQTQTLAVARSKTGGTFPVGTIIQLIPQEAMVKRRKGWNPATNDWEFFALKVNQDGSEIVTRGREEVKNQFGGNCYNCHAKSAPQWDLVCGQNRGCDPLPFDAKTIESLQQADPRCP